MRVKLYLKEVSDGAKPVDDSDIKTTRPASSDGDRESDLIEDGMMNNDRRSK